VAVTVSGAKSLPTRGEWIEIGRCYKLCMSALSLSPHGESGLKLGAILAQISLFMSLPAWGGWIKITQTLRIQ
jgi:hypothetical protein